MDPWQRGHGALNTWLKRFTMILLIVGIKNRKRPARRQAFGDGFSVGWFFPAQYRDRGRGGGVLLSCGFREGAWEGWVLPHDDGLWFETLVSKEWCPYN